MSKTRKLFLCRQIVLLHNVIDGGVLVDANGVIENIISNEDVPRVLSPDIEVIKTDENCFLMSGIVDSHVHVNEPGRTHWEGFRTATSAAAAGGVTTIVDMPLNSIPPTTTVENFNEKLEAARDNIYVDCGFWGGVIPGNEKSLKPLVEAGVVGFKCFLCPSGVDEFPCVDENDLEKAFGELDETDVVLAFHAELETNTFKDGSQEGADPEAYSLYLQSRPQEMEIEAIKLISTVARNYSTKIHIVHVSSAAAVKEIEQIRSLREKEAGSEWNYGVTAETCHHYLTFNSEEIPKGRTEFKCAPPIRDEENRQKLWRYLEEERLNLVVSDHSPCPADMKCGDFLSSWGGIASVQFGLSVFWSEARKRGMTLHDVTKLMSFNPAKLCGLHKKGSIEPNKHADFVVFNPHQKISIKEECILHKNKLTPYKNLELTGRVMQTYLRGQLVFDGIQVLSPPRGLCLARNSIL